MKEATPPLRTMATKLAMAPTKVLAVGDYLPMANSPIKTITPMPGGGIEVLAGGMTICFSECSANLQTTEESTVILCGKEV